MAVHQENRLINGNQVNGNCAQNDRGTKLHCPGNFTSPLENGRKEANNNIKTMGLSKDDNEERSRIELIAFAKANWEGLPNDIDSWSFEKTQQYILNEALGKNEFPECISYLVPGLVRPGDCGKLNLPKPEWLDMDLFRLGQKFAHKYLAALFTSKLIMMGIVLSDTDSLKGLLTTGMTGTPYQSFKRFSDTIKHMRIWYTSDPWEVGSPAYKSFNTVRKMHLLLRKRLFETSFEKLDADSKFDKPWSMVREIVQEDAFAACPVMNNPVYKMRMNEKYRAKPLNQTEMAITQFAFVGPILIKPEAFGCHGATEEEFEGFCHMWRCFGYLLGIEDEYNFCNGTFPEIKERSRTLVDLLIKPNLTSAIPEWEHMFRCLLEGVRYYCYVPSFEAVVLYAAHCMDMPMPRLAASAGYFTRLQVTFFKWVFHYCFRIPGMHWCVRTYMNNAVDKALSMTPKEHAFLQEKSAKTLLEIAAA